MLLVPLGATVVLAKEWRRILWRRPRPFRARFLCVPPLPCRLCANSGISFRVHQWVHHHAGNEVRVPHRVWRPVCCVRAGGCGRRVQVSRRGTWGLGGKLRWYECSTGLDFIPFSLSLAGREGVGRPRSESESGHFMAKKGKSGCGIWGPCYVEDGSAKLRIGVSAQSSCGCTSSVCTRREQSGARRGLLFATAYIA